jgi:hypothetical protein
MTVKSRMITDRFADSDFVYTPHLMEQTLFWLTLATSRAKAFPRTYFLLPFHKRLGEKIGKPVVIHYTGSVDRINIILYKYLVVSFFEWLRDAMYGKGQSFAYWFVFSDSYCRHCHHIK